MLTLHENVLELVRLSERFVLEFEQWTEDGDPSHFAAIRLMKNDFATVSNGLQSNLRAITPTSF